MWEVLPCIRAALAEELIKRGLFQNEISKILGITQAVVSQYTSKKRGSKLNFQEDAKEEIKKLVDDLVHGAVDDLVMRICRKIIYPYKDYIAASTRKTRCLRDLYTKTVLIQYFAGHPSSGWRYLPRR